MQMIPLSKQYVIYDFNSFVADWGGYMGLVLGFREDSSPVTKVPKIITLTNSSFLAAFWKLTMPRSDY